MGLGVRYYNIICTMPSQKIKGTACTIYSVNHRLPAVYTVVVVYGSYTLECSGLQVGSPVARANLHSHSTIDQLAKHLLIR